MWDAEIASDWVCHGTLRHMRTHAGALSLSAQSVGPDAGWFSGSGGAAADSACHARRAAGREDSVSATRVVSQMPRSQAGRGRKARYDDEYDGERADVLFYRSQALAIVRHFFEIASQIGCLLYTSPSP